MSKTAALSTPSSTAANPSLGSATLILPALLLVDSLHFVFARLLLPYISPTVSATFVLSIGTALVGAYGLATKRLRWQTLTGNLRFFLVVGFCVAASTNINYAAVRFIDAGTASMLGKLTTVFALVFGVVWLRERLSRVQLIGAGLAIAGAFVIAFQPVDALRLGTLMLVVSTFLYAFHMAIVKRDGGEMDFLNFFFFRLLATSIFLLLLSTGWRTLAPLLTTGRTADTFTTSTLVWPSLTAWGLLLLVAVVDVVISRALYYLALRRLNVSLLSVMLTLSPVAAVLWSILLFRERPTVQQLIGGAIVLAGVAIVTGWGTSRRR